EDHRRGRQAHRRHAADLIGIAGVLRLALFCQNRRSRSVNRGDFSAPAGGPAHGFVRGAPVDCRPSMTRAIHLRKSAIYLGVAGALALALPLAARAQARIDAFGAKVTEGISGIHAQAGGDAAKTTAGCTDFLARVLDLPAMAKTAARDAWERMSAEQRDGYEKAFTKRLS